MATKVVQVLQSQTAGTHTDASTLIIAAVTKALDGVHSHCIIALFASALPLKQPGDIVIRTTSCNMLIHTPSLSHIALFALTYCVFCDPASSCNHYQPIVNICPC